MLANTGLFLRKIQGVTSKRQFYQSSVMNFKFKFTETMARDEELKLKQKEEEELKKKARPALHTYDSSLIMGRVSHDRYKKVVKIGVPKHRLNEYYLLYVKEQDNVYALDEKNLTNPGDWVLLRRNHEISDEKVTHVIEKVVYKYGHYVDPITKKRSSGLYFDEDKEEYEKVKLQL